MLDPGAHGDATPNAADASIPGAPRPLPLKVRAALDDLVSSFTEDDCAIIFLGAGVGVDSKKRHLPTGKQLSEKLAKECGLDWHEYVSLATTAFYYESLYSRAKLHRLLRSELDPPETPDMPPLEPSATIESVA